MAIRIVLADDHQMTRESLSLVLSQQPDFSIVAQTGDGRSAVRLAEEHHPDIAVIDVTMPGLNGVEVTRQISALGQNIRVIILSMHIERQFVSEALSAGASGYVLKDSPVEELVQAIRTVAKGETFLGRKVQEVLVNSLLNSGASAWGTAHLTPREREVLQLVAEGKNTKEIALLLHLSSKTVEGHRRQVMEKLDLYSVADLTRYAIKEGVTSLT